MKNTEEFLISLLCSAESGNHLVTCRSDEELVLLKRWLSGETEDKAPVEEEDKSFFSALGKCSLCPGPLKKKFPAGSGENRVMLILNPPALITESEKIGFREGSLELMKKMLASINLDYRKCYISSLIKCDSSHPAANPGEMIRNCSALIKREIAEAAPRIIIVLGELLPVRRLFDGSEDFEWFQLEHPITLIKNPEMKRQAWTTLKTAEKQIRELELS